MFSSAIDLQLKDVERLYQRSLPTRLAEAQKDADTIMTAIRNISGLCDIFQVSVSNRFPRPHVYIDRCL